jgi:hypothetical protein
MTDYELNFSLKIEEMLSRISDPAYRCLVVEVNEIIISTENHFLVLDVRSDKCFIKT